MSVRVVNGTFYAYTDFTAAVHLCEVDVDRETGAVRVVRSAAIHDVGVVLDPAMVRGQIEGGVAMGLGTALTEETLWSPEGRMLNPTLLDYRIPTLGEVPPIEVDPHRGGAGSGAVRGEGDGRTADHPGRRRGRERASPTRPGPASSNCRSPRSA